MQSYPHHYSVTATGLMEGEVVVESQRLPSLSTAAPEEFGGPGDCWSPETLCVGAVADCFILTFRSVARAAKLSWASLRCEVLGTLDRVEGVTRFTHFSLRATLDIVASSTEGAARNCLERAERACLISNSLKGSFQLEMIIQTRA